MFKTVTRIGLAGLLAVASLAQATVKAPESLRIGYQKGQRQHGAGEKPCVAGEAFPGDQILMGRVPCRTTDAGGAERREY